MDGAFAAAAREFRHHSGGVSRTVRVQPPWSRAGFHNAKRTGRTNRAHPAQSFDRTGSCLTNGMEIPYTVSTRPDTGLWNAKIGIWLFLASEVMLFGGLFSAYIFLR